MYSDILDSEFEKSVSYVRRDRVILTSSVLHLDNLWQADVDRVDDAVFIPTAAERFKSLGYNDYFVDQERAWLTQQQDSGKIKDITELNLTSASKNELSGILKKTDLIFVGGGNVQYILEALQRTEADKIIVEQVRERQSLYLGRSAGAIIAGPSIEPRGTFWPSLAYSELKNTDGLNLLNVYPVPHVDSDGIMNRLHSQSGLTGWRTVSNMLQTLPVVLLHDKPEPVAEGDA